MTAVLTEPLEMFNAYVVDFTCSVGYGAESSTMQMTLAEDPDHVDSNGNPAPKTVRHKKPRLDEDGKFIPDGSGSIEYDMVDGFPEVGTCCQFKFEGFEFVGILQRYNYNQSLSGNLYDVTFESPSKALDGVQVILDKFEGTVFTEANRYVPSEGENFTSQIRNVYNPFGLKENYAFGGLFGGSGRNEFGFDAKELLGLIESISRSEFTFTNPSGNPDSDTYTNDDDDEVIGGPIHFGESQFVIDFDILASLLPDFLRIKGDFMSINAIVQECTDMILHDYVTYIKPTTTRVQTGTTGGFNPTPTFTQEVQNGVTLPTLDGDDNVTGPVISFKYLDKKPQPQPNIVETLVNQKKGTTLISATNGKELADAVTQKLIIGGDATRVWHAGMQYMIPVYGKDHQGAWLTGNGFDDQSDVPVCLDNGSIYLSKIIELRAALSGFKTWCWYHVVGKAYGYTNVNNPIFSQFARMTTSIFSSMSNNALSPFGIAAGFDGSLAQAAAQQDALDGIQGRSDGSQIFDAVLNTAQNYYGKTYFVLLPVEPGGIDNNIRFTEQKSESAWQMADSGWDPTFTIKDIDAYDDEGRLKACAGYFPSYSAGSKQFDRDFSEIENPLPYVSPAADLVGATNITVDKQIYWRENPYFQSNNNPYDDVSAMVHVTVPRVFEYVIDQSMSTAVSGPRAGVDGVFNAIAGGTSNPQLAQLAGSTQWSSYSQGFSNYATLENGVLALKFMPRAVRPFEISLPQSSTRYTWGPWYRYSAHRGKAEVEQSDQLRPEVFGSAALMDDSAFALAGAAVADMYQSESGTIEVAEFPQYNFAERFNTNGPYITKMSVKVGTSGITTNYEFSTWTRKFGKIAKYNVDRIAAINKNRIAAMRSANQEGSGPKRQSPQRGSSQAQKQQAQNPIMTNFMSGLKVPMQIGQALFTGQSVWAMSNKDGSVSVNDFARKVKLGGQVFNAYDVSFGCTQEQLFSPVGVQHPNNVRLKPDVNLPDPKSGFSYIRKPTALSDTKDGLFDTGNSKQVSPTSFDLDPYFRFEKVDFGATVTNDFQWFGGNQNNLAFERRNNVSNNADEYRTYGVKGPMLMSGWGYDVNGNPVPGKQNKQFDPAMPSQDRSSWKSGPVDLKWDEERQVWAGGLQFVEGVLTKSITRPLTPFKPTTSGKMKLRRRFFNGNEYKWETSDEEITITNRDPSLKVTIGANGKTSEGYEVYCMCVRINYEWRVVYVSCDDFATGEGEEE